MQSAQALDASERIRQNIEAEHREVWQFMGVFYKKEVHLPLT